MRALTVAPGVPNSARVDDVPDPPASDGAVLVRTMALGVCGTDRDIVSGHYGWAPPGARRLVLGHEFLGKVEEAPAGLRREGRRHYRRHSAPARPGSLFGLRRRRVGYVP